MPAKSGRCKLPAINSAKGRARSAQKKPVDEELASWRKKHGHDPSQLVFVVEPQGHYPALRKALRSRGWVDNTEAESAHCFNLKWTFRPNKIDYKSLRHNQVVNHFERAYELCTKEGLCKHLRNAHWYGETNADLFFPRCYDLSSELELFVADMRISSAAAVLERACAAEEVPRRQLELAVKVCEQFLRDRKALCEDDAEEEHRGACSEEAGSWDSDLLSPDEWEMLDCGRGVPEPEGQPQEPGEQASWQELLSQLRGCHSQAGLDGSSNGWIVKPAGKSRGRGIQCFDSLRGILDYTQKGEEQWVVQKYIERPLVVCDRKFDIRLYVLVTSWNPLTLWFYNSCYLRFCSVPFSMADLSDKFAHLANNSVQKYHKGKTEIEGNMWHCEQFAEYLQDSTGDPDVWKAKVLPSMKQTVVHTMQCYQEVIVDRPGSNELYGFDLMIDEELRPWLIEVNSSPVMEYSTAVTKRICKAVLEDYVKVVVDLPLRMRELKLSKMSRAAIGRFDTGDWELIHRAPLVGTAENPNSTALQCTGVQLAQPTRKPRERRAPAIRAASGSHTSRPVSRPSSESRSLLQRAQPRPPTRPSSESRGGRPSPSRGGLMIETCPIPEGVVGCGAEEPVLSPAQRIKQSRQREESEEKARLKTEAQGIALLQSQFNFAF